ncbi:DUF3465 domain-containing protein [Zhongshania guokunii]|uniref:DUF3465 domain-containing protein n=1 Tax=Zhongshania guokunii TaxID=641783 RepID=A0ABV3U3F2_9GAMM
MKKPVAIAIFAIVAAYSWYQQDPSAAQDFFASTSNNSTIRSPSAAEYKDRLTQAYRQQLSDIQIEGQGKVEKILADDTKGSRHQKFILRISAEQTVLVAHNIDLAPRIAGLKEGDEVRFYGEYEWNQRGGVIHWTHRDPAGRHPHGWLELRGRRYQ